MSDSLERYASVFLMLALLLLRLLLVHTAHMTPEKRVYFRIINHNIKCSNDDFETNALNAPFIHLFTRSFRHASNGTTLSNVA